MPILSFGEYRPDVSDYEGQYSKTILGVLPRGDGYGPMRNLAAFSSALPAACRGLYFARKLDGTVFIFAGTSTKLYLLNNTTQAWTDVSKGASTYSTLATSAQWDFAQFNNLIFATQVNAVLQVYNLASSSAFDDAPGSPPQAAYVSVVNRFLVLSGIATNTTRIQWSGLNDTTNWTAGTGSSDYQDLPDGGITRGVAGGEFGIIFQDLSIRRLTYAPGSLLIFTIDRISANDGLYAPYSLVTAGDRVFFLSPQGFKMLQPGGYPTPIGKERIDRTFFADLDKGNLQLVIGASDPQQNRVYWTYKSGAQAQSMWDKILVYDYVLDRWSLISLTGEYISSLASSGVTLEGVDTAFGTNIDTLSIGSLDDIAGASTPALAAVTTAHKVGLFTGDHLEGIMETSEHGGDGKRFFVREFRPVSDSPTIYGSLETRDNAQATSVLSNEIAVNSLGLCTFRNSTRYARARVRIPAGTQWSYASGVEPTIVPEGYK